MHIFKWDLKAADRLSTDKNLHLKGYKTEFLDGWQKNI